jgi:predicted secreted protein with PEFG-CTERM motif
MIKQLPLHISIILVFVLFVGVTSAYADDSSNTSDSVVVTVHHGTVPEFGHVMILALAASMISVIAITTRLRMK